MGKIHRVGDLPRIAGKADSDNGIPAVNTDHLFKDFSFAGCLHQQHIFEQHVEIIGKKCSQGQCASGCKNIDFTGSDNRVHRTVEIFMGSFLHSAANNVNILIKHKIENVRRADSLGRDVHPLNGRKLVPNHFLHGLLKLRVTRVTDLSCKAYHSGFADPHRGPKFGGRHECNFIIVFLNILRNSFLAF